MFGGGKKRTPLVSRGMSVNIVKAVPTDLLARGAKLNSGDAKILFPITLQLRNNIGEMVTWMSEFLMKKLGVWIG
jgi:hypothetical protein